MFLQQNTGGHPKQLKGEMIPLGSIAAVFCSLSGGERIVSAVAAGFLLDFIFGDPAWIYHPIRMIGNLISFLTRTIRGILPKTKAGEHVGGGLLVILTVAVSAALSWIVLYLLYKISPIAGFALEALLCGLLVAARSLQRESMKIYHLLKKDDLEGARKAVSMIVGRDTDKLSTEGVVKAAVETVAENASDGVIAPLFWMMIGGAVWGFGYKAVNTMDSMVGYKNREFRYFGTCAAITDDVVNFLPARLAALFMIAASFLLRMDAGNAARIWKRDRRKHASPNSAQTESVMAGALGLQLADDASYFGETVHKQHIGDAKREPVPEDIIRADRLMMAASWLSLLVFALLRYLAFAMLHGI